MTVFGILGLIVGFLIICLLLFWALQFGLLVIGLLIFGVLISVGQWWAYLLAGLLAIAVILISSKD